MMQVYDDVTTHRSRLPGDVPSKGGATHIGMFFAWCVANGLASDWHEATHPGELARLQSRWYSGREYVLRFMDGKLTSEHLTAEGQAFAADYLASGAYLRDYEETLRGSRPSLYHVPDTWQSYEQLAPVLDARFEAWRAHVQAPTREAEISTQAPPAQGHGMPEETAEVEPPPAEPSLPSDAALAGALGAAEAPTPEAQAPLVPGDTQAGREDDAWSYDDVVQQDAPPVPPPLPPRTQPTTPTAPIPRRHPRGTTGRRRSSAAAFVALAVFLFLYGCARLHGCQRAARRRRLPDFESFRSSPRSGPRQEQPRIPPEIRQKLQELLRRRSPPRAPQEALPVVPWPKLGPQQQKAARELGVAVRFENALKMRFVLIPGGAFVMGSPPTEAGRHEGEIQHNVVLEPFYMMTCEVSNALYRRYDENHHSDAPRGFRGFDARDVPATSISWSSARDFCQWLTERCPPGPYRLPTEAEWEYACRADAATTFPWGDSPNRAPGYANLADLTMRDGMPPALRTAVESGPGWAWWPGRDGYVGMAPVGSFHPNAWGLHDMIGNAYEWCADWAAPYDPAMVRSPTGPAGGTMHVIRGGAADAPVWKGRSAWRGAVAHRQSMPNVGFRVVSPVPAR